MEDSPGSARRWIITGFLPRSVKAAWESLIGPVTLPSEFMKISTRTVEREMSLGQAWLVRELKGRSCGDTLGNPRIQKTMPTERHF
jgi:hypothetical protein